MRTTKMSSWIVGVFFFLIASSVSAGYEQDDIRVRPEPACKGLSGRFLTLCEGEPVYAATPGGVVALYPTDGSYYTGDGWWRVYVPIGELGRSWRSSRNGFTMQGPVEYWIVRTWTDGGLVAQRVENSRGIVGVEEDAQTGKAVVYIVHPAVSAVSVYGDVEYGTAWKAYTSQQLVQELLERVNKEISRGHRAFGEDKTVIAGGPGEP